MEFVVGIDMATAAVRAVAADAEGRVHAAAERLLHAPACPHPGWSEQDARLWWPAAADVVRRVVERLGTRRVVAVSVSATSGTAVALDADAHLVGPALCSQEAGGSCRFGVPVVW